MPELPPGWWVTNSSGSYAGPPPIQDDDGDQEADANADNNEGGLDIRPDSPGWEDVEPDTEALSVQCLLCSQQFPSAPLMLNHCKSLHGFDFLAVVKQQGLDFYATIKYINFIRLNVQNGLTNPTQFSDPSGFASDELAKPVMEDDALLFTLDEVVSFDDAADVDGDEPMLVDGEHAG